MNKDSLNNYLYDADLLLNESEVIQELIKIRLSKKLSQRDAALLANIKQPILANLERGKHSPSLSTLFKILKAYGYKIVLEKEE